MGSVKVGEKSQGQKDLIFRANFASCSSKLTHSALQSPQTNPFSLYFFPQDIDGQALLLLTLPTVQECMELKLGPAIKLCHQIERVKVAFYAQYAN